jgi:hypothetical protein
MTSRILALLPLVALTAVVACEGEDTQAESQSADATEARGLLALAPRLALGDTVEGQFEGGQLDAYRIDVLRGDKLTVTETVTDGDAAPDALLFASGSTAVKSAGLDADGSRLEKRYVIDDSGPHYLAVRAFKSTKAGRYSLTVTCTGGPCAGEPIEEEIDEDQAGECIKLARECAFAGLPDAGTSVGPVRARSLFGDCLDEVSVGGVTCKKACDTEEARGICDEVIGMLPFYADQSAECLTELADCMDSCYDAGDGASGLEEGPEAQCLRDGFNGTCDGYARGHEKCGGTYADDTLEECHQLCESTSGAWMDDLDLICVEGCSEFE